MLGVGALGERGALVAGDGGLVLQLVDEVTKLASPRAVLGIKEILHDPHHRIGRIIVVSGSLVFLGLGVNMGFSQCVSNGRSLARVNQVKAGNISTISLRIRIVGERHSLQRAIANITISSDGQRLTSSLTKLGCVNTSISRHGGANSSQTHGTGHKRGDRCLQQVFGFHLCFPFLTRPGARSFLERGQYRITFLIYRTHPH